MLLTTEVEISVDSEQRKKFLINKGYTNINIGEKILIKIEDAPRGANYNPTVNVKCDYCGKEFEKSYVKFIKGRKFIKKDACSKCSSKKQEDVRQAKLLIPEEKEKIEKISKERSERVYNTKRTRTIDDVKKEFAEVGYTVISNEYISNQQKIQYLCPKHGLKEITYAHFAQGERCKDCQCEKRRGENNNMWNGGTTEISSYLRDSTSKWTKQILNENNYKCEITGLNNKNLNVHHAEDTFSNIMINAHKDNLIDIKSKVSEYTEDELKILRDYIEEKHNDLKGVVLLTEIHNLYHRIYGSKDGTYNNYLEFKERCLNGDLKFEVSDIIKSYESDPNYKKIICLNNNKIYNSIKEAAKDTNCVESSISNVINHYRGRKSTHGYKFQRYSEYLKEKERDKDV